MKYGKFVEVEGTLGYELGFLEKALNNNSTLANMGLGYIHIEPSEKKGMVTAVATDGRHLHSIEIESGMTDLFGITLGYWRVLKSHVDKVWIAKIDDEESKGWKYPPWRSIIPTENPAYKTVFKGFTFDDGHDANYNGLAKFIHGFPEATALNLKHLSALGTGCEWNVEYYGQGKPVKFTAGDRMALIMTLRISEE